ncbi:hypothetical protein [Brassicibacter mesophilus]|uniref:hypothetical protein n=1 Tax=Brassicibacter mesophilus TaxID=745119 RepID=UPI003D219E08
MKKLRLLSFIPLIMTTPAITIGAVAMYYNKIPAFIWMQDIVCLLIIGLISYFVVSSKLNIGVVSLVILPIPFILFPPKNYKLPSICIGLYSAILLFSTLFGNFSVPLMGYGFSPIIGYFISIMWYTKLKIKSQLSYKAN